MKKMSARILLVLTLLASIRDIYTREIEEDVQCRFNVSPDAISKFTNKTVTVAYLKLESARRIKISKTDKKPFINPTRWQWTFGNEKESGYPTLRYPWDSFIVSFGTIPYKKVSLNLAINERTGECLNNLNQSQFMLSVATSLAQLLNKTKYSNNYFCLTVKNPISGFPNRIYHSFGISQDYTEYRCCELNYQRVVRCDEFVKQTDYLNLSKIVGLLLFLFLPLTVSLIPEQRKEPPKGNLMMTKPGDRNLHEFVQCDLQQLSDDFNDLDLQDWMYLDSNAQLGLGFVIRSVLLFDVCSITISRLRRIACVILSPMLLYYIIYRYDSLGFDILSDLLDADIPVGPYAVLFDFVPAYHNWWGFGGGPHILFANFIIGCSIILCVPRSLSDLLVDHLVFPENTYTFVFPAAKDVAKYGSDMFKYKTFGFEKLSHYLRAKAIMVLNYEFWIHFVKIWWSRASRCSTNLTERYKPTTILQIGLMNLVFFLLCFIMILVAMIEGAFTLIFHLAPGISFIFFVQKSYIYYFHNQHFLARQRRLVYIPLRILIIIVVVFLISYIITAYTVIFMHTVTIASEIFVYVFGGLLINSQDLIGYTIIITTTIAYLSNSLMGLANSYNYLFLDVLKSTEHEHVANSVLQSPNSGMQYAPEVLVMNVEPGKSEPTTKVILNGVLFSPTDRGIEAVDDNSCKEVYCKTCLIYRHSVPAISRDLFDFVVSNVRPLRQEILLTVTKMSIIFLFLYIAVTIINAYSLVYKLSMITQVSGLVLASALPGLFKLLRPTGSDAISKKSQYAHVRGAVRDFHQQMKHFHS
ncbi:uncharacterized protein LOC141899743 [Tubulanus polymorphus]|uniref:uncharacterized protein LOC141899743 n=1 Tax=Tubulanus polymorphus TaxID=672921 RepID=UPI003DA3AAAB